MQNSVFWKRRVLVVVSAAAAIVWAREWLWQAAAQLLMGMIVALAALPVMKRFERHFKPGLAAGLTMLAALMGLICMMVWLLPALIRQGRELAALLPSLYASAERLVMQWQGWFARYGLDSGIRQTVFQKGQEAVSAAVPAVAGRLGGFFSNVGRWMLSPVFAFYFLRDRRQIGGWLYTLLPLSSREIIVRILREMRRETAGYLRGQLMISAIVGVLTAAGLLFCGVPAWLLLGALMGILEWIPYVGPFAGSVIVLLFALPGGLSRTLWALGVVVAVQQLEGGILSPQLMSGATRLHPLVVVLCVVIGGAAGGVTGVLVSVPLLLCARAALRVVSLYTVNPARP